MTPQYIQAAVTLLSANDQRPSFALSIQLIGSLRGWLRLTWGWLKAAELEAAGLEAAMGPDVGRRRARGDELQ